MPLSIVLVHPEIPGNTGAVGRTCVALDAGLVLIRPLGFHITDARVKRSGLDYWPHLDYEVVENWDELSAKLAAPMRAGRIWLLTKTATQSYTTAKYEAGDVLVFGSESSGLPEELRTEYAAQTLRVPMRSQVRSLNLSATAALVMYEAVRQLGVSLDETP